MHEMDPHPAIDARYRAELKTLRLSSTTARCVKCGRLRSGLAGEEYEPCLCGHLCGSEPSEPSYLAMAAALDKTYQALDPRVEFPPAVDASEQVAEAVKEGPC